jgi:hypothetical protein
MTCWTNQISQTSKLGKQRYTKKTSQTILGIRQDHKVRLVSQLRQPKQNET